MRVDYSRFIRETESELITLEKQLRGKSTLVRIQMLRLLKSGNAASLQECARLLGYSVRQLNRWWALYHHDGLEALLEIKMRPGKSSQLTPEAWSALLAEVEAGRIMQLEDARIYLRDQWGIEYASVNGIWWQLKQHQVRLK